MDAAFRKLQAEKAAERGETAPKEEPREPRQAPEPRTDKPLMRKGKAAGWVVAPQIGDDPALCAALAHEGLVFSRFQRLSLLARLFFRCGLAALGRLLRLELAEGGVHVSLHLRCSSRRLAHRVSLYVPVSLRRLVNHP